MFALLLIGLGAALIVLAILFYWFALAYRSLALHRVRENPILQPIAGHWWESEAVFNPAAFVYNGRVHLLYRALGRDGISRIGYASSADGIHFDERLPTPAYEPSRSSLPDPRGVHMLSYKTLTYDTVNNASGGGWGGSEDPRAVTIDGMLYMIFTAFEGWNSERITLTWLPLEHLSAKQWLWNKGVYLSPPGEVQKNWLLFPEKINGKFAILHSVSPDILIDYFDSLDAFDGKTFIEGSVRSGGRAHSWDKAVRGAGAPPLKTKKGWLLFYHGFDPAHADIGYKVGAMLLDLTDPTKVLYRSSAPVLEPSEWYENDWKPGVAYASGAVIKNDMLFVYYGGGDKRIAMAKAPLRAFLKKLMAPQNKV
ncbi:MAG: hypothetical protein Q7R71_02030 [bacterium]|nr:hypothetical protein [bacterium]